MLFVFTFSLCACKDKPDAFFQTKAQNYVYGNGGLAVESDGYLYFVNGFINSANQVSKNDSYSLGSLKVAKLNRGLIETDVNGSVKDDYLRTISDKLCGFEATGLYIFNDYLYFASTCQEDEKGAGWAKERVDFNRIKLNNTGKVERIYQSNVNWGEVSYNYFTNDNKVVLMVCEAGKNLYRIDAYENKHPVTTVCDNVTSYAFNTNSDYARGSYNSGLMFYSTTTDNGNKFVLYNPLTGECDEKYENAEIKVLYVTNTAVYYTRSVNDLTELWQYKISNTKINENIKLLTYSGDKNLIFTEDGVVLSLNGKTINRELFNNQISNFDNSMPEEEEDITIMGIANGSVIYLTGSFVKAINYTTGVVSELGSVEGAVADYHTIAGSYVYFYSKINENSYLYRASVIGGDCSMVGVLEEADIPKEEE